MKKPINDRKVIKYKVVKSLIYIKNAAYHSYSTEAYLVDKDDVNFCGPEFVEDKTPSTW